MEIAELDPHDETAFAQWFAVLEAADRLDRPDEPGWLLHEQRQISLDGMRPGADVLRVCLVLRTDDGVVGAARLALPQRDNQHLCEIDLAVHPAARRRGLGRALTEEVERRVLDDGRTTVVAYGDEPPGHEGSSAPRLAAAALGWEVCQTEVRRDIDLPLDPARVADLERTCGPYAADYDIRIWWDHCPDDLVDDRAELSRLMSTDIPKDRLDWREEVWDAARIRHDEELSLAMDRTYVGAGAVHRPTGRMVAFTDMGVPRAERRRAYQWETLVSSPHRGRRLGALVKLAALQELAATSPATTFISTWNAQENGPMIAVNDALGARTNGQLAILQRKLG